MRSIVLVTLVCFACSDSAPLTVDASPPEGEDAARPRRDGGSDPGADGGVPRDPRDAGDAPPTADCDAWEPAGAIDYLPIIPGRFGFGLDTPAGSGRGLGGARVFEVTTLDDGGAGSLRECMEADGPRVCVFEVSGTIRVDGAIEVRSPNLTIAGQTAPSPGITLAGATLGVYASDVLIQHVRIRVGDGPSGLAGDLRDAVAVGWGSTMRGIVFDHVSMSWGIDETFGTWSDAAPVTEVAVIDSIVSEALSCSLHPEGCHSAGLIIGRASERILLAGSLYIHNDWRNPLVRDSFDDVVIANNAIFADGGQGLVIGDNWNSTGPSNADVIGNTIAGVPMVLGDPADPAGAFSEGSRFHFGGNACDDGAPPECVQIYAPDDRVASEPTVDTRGFAPRPASEVTERVLAYAGARPLDRDSVDARAVDDFRTRTRRIIDSQEDVGGFPELAVNSEDWIDPEGADEIPATDPYTGNPNPGYTTRELLLHDLARRWTCPAR